MKWKSMLADPRILNEGAGPVPQQVDEQLHYKYHAEGQVQLVSDDPQPSLVSVRGCHPSVVLGLEDADKEVLRCSESFSEFMATPLKTHNE